MRIPTLLKLRGITFLYMRRPTLLNMRKLFVIDEENNSLKYRFVC
jgi:hypothetical protein